MQGKADCTAAVLLLDSISHEKNTEGVVLEKHTTVVVAALSFFQSATPSGLSARLHRNIEESTVSLTDSVHHRCTRLDIRKQCGDRSRNSTIWV